MIKPAADVARRRRQLYNEAARLKVKLRRETVDPVAAMRRLQEIIRERRLINFTLPL